MKTGLKNMRRIGGRRVLMPVILLLFINRLVAQCPANIDFETGTFNGWQCWTGTVDAVGSQNQIALTPIAAPDPARQIMLSTSPGDGLDKYGKFPRNCPNGSGHSIQLGNELNGHIAEGISYQFTVPAASTNFKLIVNYAIVLQDPDHNAFQQPRFQMETFNVTDNVPITCSSNDFIAGTAGYKPTGISLSGIPVNYKDWSGITINLSGYAGKTIRLFFRTAGCTYIDHFCYAYIDVSSRCDGSFETSAFCPGDTAVNLTAPFGFKNYTWYNSNFSQVLGNDQVLHLKPVPPSGTGYAVEILPIDGFACKDTLTAKVMDTLHINANAGPDMITCNSVPVQIGNVPVPGLNYQWSPATYLDDATIANPVASPPAPAQYILTVRSSGGGCVAKDTMQVFTKLTDTKVDLIGKTEHCIGFGPFPALKVSLSDSIQWYKDAVAITGATQTLYTVTQTGSYYAKLFSNGCALPLKTSETSFFIDSPTPGITYPVVDAAFNFPEPLKARPIGNSVAWTPATSLNDRLSYTPVFTGLTGQLYTIQMKTASGCVTVDTQLVKTHKKIDIYVPTAFTPDGNGKNDRLRPMLLGFVKVNYFRLYDRWGKLIFSMNSDQPGWDGKVNGQPAEMQAVVWVIEAVDVDGVVHHKQGTTVLYR